MTRLSIHLTHGVQRLAFPGLIILDLVVLASMAGPASATDWRRVVAAPKSFVGQEIKFSPAFCGGGGPQGADASLVQCSIGDRRLYVETRKIVPSTAAQKINKTCGGLDVEEASPFCRFTVKLVARGVRVETGSPGTPIITSDAIEVR